MTRGRRPRVSRLSDVRFALRHLDDAIALDGSPIAHAHAVQARADRAFPRRTCALGLALSSILHEILRDIAADLGADSPLGIIASSLDHGMTQAHAARAVGITEEHLSRHWKPTLLKLVLQRLEYMNREVAELPAIAG